MQCDWVNQLSHPSKIIRFVTASLTKSRLPIGATIAVRHDHLVSRYALTSTSSSNVRSICVCGEIQTVKCLRTWLMTFTVRSVGQSVKNMA